MKLEKIITLASAWTRPELLAMERSLRAVGCSLPLWVIPYDESHFELPAGAQWWPMPKLYVWLSGFRGRAVCRKYQCLLTSNYQFVDTDVIFLKNPEEVLAPHMGFITSCKHWSNPDETQTPQTRALFSKKSTTWPRWVFNSGQFACDRILYGSLNALQEKAQNPQLQASVLDLPWHEQPGLNALVIESGVDIYNLTLPPVCMESTWAGDYVDERYARYWKEVNAAPYLIHWAGRKPTGDYAIDALFLRYLSASEKEAYLRAHIQKKTSSTQHFIHRLRSAYKAFKETS